MSKVISVIVAMASGVCLFYWSYQRGKRDAYDVAIALLRQADESANDNKEEAKPTSGRYPWGTDEK